MSREQAPNPELQAKADSLEDTASRAEVALALGRLGARVRKNKKPKSDRKPKSSTSASSSVVGDDLDDEDEIIVEESRSGKELQSAQDDFDFDSFGNTADHKGPVRNSQTVSDHFFHPEQYESFHDIESADATAGDRSHLVDLDSKSEETEGHIVVESRDGRGRGGSVLATHLVESGDETDDDMKSARGATCWGCCCRCLWRLFCR
ncbi:uncharacterized protein LOC134845604 isoform X2 [Symsagittifera roscoffensis]|uniref:uncharacterized protein LOC134845604 isoform X2 n=1 Tax=Symsagittifera roscoffensis TaxID=84072 RepID=UPI00307B2F0F